MYVSSSELATSGIVNSYHRTGFNCDNLLIANCESFQSSQLIETQNELELIEQPLPLVANAIIIKFAV